MPPYATHRPLFRLPGKAATYLPPMTPAVLGLTGAGIILGLLLGLFVAWVVWPVEWSNAWPADLSEEARAQYLAAVAESYVYYGDAQAAEVARNRLFNLNDDLAAEIAAAQAFFADQPNPNARVYISNLGQLAQALNVQSPDIIPPETIVAAPAGEAPAVVPPAGEEAGVGDSVRAWVNWTLTVLAAIVLVGGGFYVMGRLNRRRLQQANDTLDDGGFDDEVVGGPGFVPAGSPRPVPPARPLRGGPFSVSSTRLPSAPARQSRPQHGEDYGFEDEGDDDVPYAHSATLETLDYRREDEQFIDDMADDMQDEPGDELFAPQAGARSDDPYVEDRYADAAFGNAEYDEEYEGDEAFGQEVAPVTTPAARPRDRAAAAPLRTLGDYTLHYQAGIPDYDQAYSIVDPQSGLLVGDVGMGISSKNNVVQNNPDHVVALDLWLVDKKDDKTYSSQDRILLSEYAVDHKLESSLTRDRGSEPTPIIPQPNLSFTLRGPNLVVDCLITEASYFQSGPAAGMFQSLRIDVTVRCQD